MVSMDHSVLLVRVYMISCPFVLERSILMSIFCPLGSRGEFSLTMADGLANVRSLISLTIQLTREVTRLLSSTLA